MNGCLLSIIVVLGYAIINGIKGSFIRKEALEKEAILKNEAEIVSKFCGNDLNVNLDFNELHRLGAKMLFVPPKTQFSTYDKGKYDGVVALTHNALCYKGTNMCYETPPTLNGKIKFDISRENNKRVLKGMMRIEIPTTYLDIVGVWISTDLIKKIGEPVLSEVTNFDYAGKKIMTTKYKFFETSNISRSDVDDLKDYIMSAISIISPNMYSEREMTQNEKERLKRFIDEQDIKFYKECIKEKINNFDNVNDFNKATSLAEKYGFEDIKSHYKQGKLLVKKIEEEEKNQYLLNLKVEENEMFNQLTKYSEYIGLDKTIEMIIDEINFCQKQISKARETYDTVIKAGTLYKEKEHDWAIAGGMATGLAGTAAGIAVSADLQYKNAEIRARNAAFMQNYHNSMFPVYDATVKVSGDYQKKVDKLKKKLEEVQKKKCSGLLNEQVMKKLCIENYKVSFSDTGAIIITADVHLKEELQLPDNVKSIADGVIMAEIIQKDCCVATLKLVAPIDGIDITKKQLVGMICSENNVKKNSPYKIVFKPYHLWIVQK